MHLENCPFCGSSNTIVGLVHPKWMLKKYHNRYVAAGCRDCGASTAPILARNHTGSPLMNEANLKAAIEKAAENWNRRSDNGRA